MRGNSLIELLEKWNAIWRSGDNCAPGGLREPGGHRHRLPVPGAQVHQQRDAAAEQQEGIEADASGDQHRRGHQSGAEEEPHGRQFISPKFVSIYSLIIVRLHPRRGTMNI